MNVENYFNMLNSEDPNDAIFALNLIKKGDFTLLEMRNIYRIFGRGSNNFQAYVELRDIIEHRELKENENRD